MKKQVLNAIKDIEKKHKVKILWAIESGSRAWGFASQDSDYDVRSIHIGNLDSYIGLDDSPKQINLNKNNNLKMEKWIKSPIVYIDSPIRKQLKKYLKGTKKIDWKSIINTNPNKILLEIKKKL